MAHFKLRPIRVHLFKYIFCPGWIPTIATLIILPILISLGFWQLHRATQKERIEQALKNQGNGLHITDIRDPMDTNLNYQKIVITGNFDNDHTLFLDNKIHRHQVGVEVLTPFNITGQKTRILVNRGFISLPNRNTLPIIQRIESQQMITGLIHFPANTIVLKRLPSNGKQPKLLETIDIQQIANQLQANFYPFLVLQQNKDQDGLVRDWHPVIFPAYRHKGYALQWFLLALTVMFIYIKLNMRKDQ